MAKIQRKVLDKFRLTDVFPNRKRHQLISMKAMINLTAGSSDDSYLNE